MGFFDRVLNFMKLNDDYDDDEFYEEEEDFIDDYEPKPRRQVFNKEPAEPFPDEPRRERSINKVTPMRPTPRKVASGMEVCVIKPSSVDDSREICETLLTNRTVILNLEGMDVELAQRIIDFISGSAFAISGNLQRISNYIFLVTPANVDISGDLQDLLGGGAIEPTPSRGGRY